MASSNKIGWNWTDSVSEQLRARKNSNAVRWYVLALPTSRQGHYQGNPARALRMELERRTRNGEPVFEYFAPSYVEVRKQHGELVRTNHPLLYNYVFIHASEAEIYRMKRFLPQYNFLPRVREKDDAYYPYLSDEAMENLKWVAASYSDVLPVYTPGPERLMKGDRIRITEGQFKGVEASVIIQPGGGRKEVMVCVENCMYVPLLCVEPGQYEVIALNADNRHVYTRLNGDRLPAGLHKALKRYHSPEGGDRRRPGLGVGGPAAICQPPAGQRCDALQTLFDAASGLCHPGRPRSLRSVARNRSEHSSADPGRTVAVAAAGDALRLHELLSGL